MHLFSVILGYSYFNLWIEIPTEHRLLSFLFLWDTEQFLCLKVVQACGLFVSSLLCGRKGKRIPITWTSLKQLQKFDMTVQF